MNTNDMNEAVAAHHRGLKAWDIAQGMIRDSDIWNDFDNRLWNAAHECARFARENSVDTAVERFKKTLTAFRLENGLPA